jgi:hypothetical protein
VFHTSLIWWNKVEYSSRIHLGFLPAVTSSQFCRSSSQSLWGTSSTDLDNQSNLPTELTSPLTSVSCRSLQRRYTPWSLTLRYADLDRRSIRIGLSHERSNRSQIPTTWAIARFDFKIFWSLRLIMCWGVPSRERKFLRAKRVLDGNEVARLTSLIRIIRHDFRRSKSSTFSGGINAMRNNVRI